MDVLGGDPDLRAATGAAGPIVRAQTTKNAIENEIS